MNPLDPELCWCIRFPPNDDPVDPIIFMPDPFVFKDNEADRYLIADYFNSDINNFNSSDSTKWYN